MKYTVVAWDSTLRTNIGPRKLRALCLANGRKGSVTKPYTTRIEWPPLGYAVQDYWRIELTEYFTEQHRLLFKSDAECLSSTPREGTGGEDHGRKINRVIYRVRHVWFIDFSAKKSTVEKCSLWYLALMITPRKSSGRLQLFAPLFSLNPWTEQLRSAQNDSTESGYSLECVLLYFLLKFAFTSYRHHVSRDKTWFP